MVQRRAARFVVSNNSREPGTVTNIMSELQWPTLERRRTVSRLCFHYAFCIRPSTTRSPSPSLRTSLSVPDTPDKPTNKDTYKLGQIPRSTSTASSLVPSKSGTACHQTSCQYMRLTCSRQRSAATSCIE